MKTRSHDGSANTFGSSLQILEVPQNGIFLIFFLAFFITFFDTFGLIGSVKTFSKVPAVSMNIGPDMDKKSDQIYPYLLIWFHFSFLQESGNLDAIYKVRRKVTKIISKLVLVLIPPPLNGQFVLEFEQFLSVTI